MIEIKEKPNGSLTSLTAEKKGVVMKKSKSKKEKIPKITVSVADFGKKSFSEKLEKTLEKKVKKSKSKK